MRCSPLFLPFFCLAILTRAAAPEAQTGDVTDSPATVLVLDVSNSMWGQITAHVVGFDVSRIEDQSGLRCLADNTGGLYLTADSADELSQAMQTVAAPSPPAVTLLALDENSTPVANPALSWTVIHLGDESAVETGLQAARLTLELGRGLILRRARSGSRRA